MTTLPEDWAGEESYMPAPESDTGGFTPVPVRVLFDENQRVPPTFCSMMTWPIPQAGINQPLLIIPRNQKRFRARSVVSFPAAGTLYLNTRPDPLSNPVPAGFTFTVTTAGNYGLPDYDAMQPVYAIASVAGIMVSVMDETYGNVAG